MKRYLILSLLIVPSLSNAGYLYHETCFDNPDNIYLRLITEYHGIPHTAYDNSVGVYQGFTLPLTTLFNNAISVPSNLCPTNTKPYCLQGPYPLTIFNTNYYALTFKFRVNTVLTDGSSSRTPAGTSWYVSSIVLPSCDKQTTPFGLEPVNLTIQNPPEWQAVLDNTVLSTPDAQTLGMLVVAVFAAAWGLRSLRHAL